jgi:RNA polymerase sigma-70 factor (ECF subfamily)
MDTLAETAPQPDGEVTRLLHLMRSGDDRAADRLLPLVLDELHALARNFLRQERQGHTLQATALINEAYLRLVGNQWRDWENRAHFVGTAAALMRRILVDYARRSSAIRRGSGLVRVPMTDEVGNARLSAERSEEVIALDEALAELEALHPRHGQVVELRYFGGLSIPEAACALGVSEITVKRDWLAARLWLRAKLRPEFTGLNG